MMRRFIFCVLSLTVAAVLPAWAQTTEQLTLDAAIRQAQQSSPSAEAARLRFAESQWQHDIFKASYLPSLSLSGSLPGLERSINEVTQPDGTVQYKPQSRLSSFTNLMITQRIPWTNTEVFAASRLGRLDLMGNRGYSQWNASPVAIGISQPLFQYNAMQWERRLEPLQLKLSRRTYAEDRAQVAEEVTRRFFDAYIARVNEEMAAFNVATNDTVYTLSQQRYTIGKIAENDLLQSELQLLNAQNELSSARIESQRALQALKLELGMRPEAELQLKPPAQLPSIDFQPEKAVAQARAHRGAFTNLRLQEMTAEREVAEAESQRGFSATLQASYGFNQQAPELAGAYRNPLYQQEFGINFQVPIFQWNEGEARVEAARAARQEVRIQNEQTRKELDQEVYFEALALKQLRRQVEIAAKADTVAARRFEVAQNRYRIGKISITELFDAQREKDAARRDYYQKLRQFWSSYYRLRRLTLYDFVEDRSLTEVWDQ